MGHKERFSKRKNKEKSVRRKKESKARGGTFEKGQSSIASKTEASSSLGPSVIFFTSN